MVERSVAMQGTRAGQAGSLRGEGVCAVVISGWAGLAVPVRRIGCRRIGEQHPRRAVASDGRMRRGREVVGGVRACGVGTFFLFEWQQRGQIEIISCLLIQWHGG